MCVIWSVLYYFITFIYSDVLPPQVRPLRIGTVSPGASPMFMHACIKEIRKESAYRYYLRLLCCLFSSVIYEST